jgi:hypothetical protein
MFRKTAAVAAAALAVPAVAKSALDVRLSIAPAAPRVGDRVTVELRPYWPYERDDGTCCRFVPANVRYPFRVQFVAGARSSVVRPQRTTDPHVWLARFRFRARGTWRVRVTNYYYDEACMRLRCAYKGPELFVRVR